MISLKREMNLTDIEELYKYFREDSKGKKVTIELPKELKEETISVLPSLIQFVATVVREDKLETVMTRIKFSKEDKGPITSASKSYLWYICACLHWLKEFKYETGESLKEDIKSVNQSINELMRNYRPLGHSFMLTCFDHLPKNAGLLKMFYQRPSYLMADEEMTEQYVNQIIKNLGEKTNKSAFRQLQIILKPLTAIIYELFKNTDDWATKDRFGNKIEPSVRGIYFRYYRNFYKNISEYCEHNASLKRYFSHPLYVPDTENKISFIEISVFDSGDGFAGRRMGENYNDDMAVEEEVEIVKLCLTKYWTNEEGKQGVVKGIGLDRVLKTTDKKGFVSIRTNKVHVFRDMVIDQYQSDNGRDNIKLYDWKTFSNVAFTEFFNVKGSVITIILPLDAVNYNK